MADDSCLIAARLLSAILLDSLVSSSRHSSEMSPHRISFSLVLPRVEGVDVQIEVRFPVVVFLVVQIPGPLFRCVLFSSVISSLCLLTPQSIFCLSG